MSLGIDWARYLQAQHPNPGETLVKHQIESYNSDFIDNAVYRSIAENSSVMYYDDWSESLKMHRKQYRYYLSEPRFHAPVLFNADGRTDALIPKLARDRNAHYLARVSCTPRVHIKTFDEAGAPVIDRTLSFNDDGPAFELPVMVGSKLEHKTRSTPPGLFSDSSWGLQGYFILNGQEKVIITHCASASNIPITLAPTKKTGQTLAVEYKSLPELGQGAPRTMSIRLINKRPLCDSERYPIVVCLPKIQEEIPIVLLLKALGVAAGDGARSEHSERRSGEAACSRSRSEGPLGPSDVGVAAGGAHGAPSDGARSDHSERRSDRAIAAMIDDVEPELWQASVLHARDYPADFIRQKLPEGCNYDNWLRYDVLPHCGADNIAKAMVIALCVKDLLLLFAGKTKPSQRDAYNLKVMVTPGQLLAQRWRQCWSILLKDISKRMRRELKDDHSIHNSSGSTDPAAAFTPACVHGFLRTHGVNNNMRQAISTGDFRVDNSSNTKKGVSQSASNPTHQSYQSQLRRVQVPTANCGKMVEPREIQTTQFGFIDMCETPEGNNVGLVNNLSATAEIAMYQPRTVEATRKVLGAALLPLASGGQAHPPDSATVGRSVAAFAARTAPVYVNGCPIGRVADPEAAIAALRLAKRNGALHPQTGVCWHSLYSAIWVDSLGGRIVRPVFRVYPGWVEKARATASSGLAPQALWLKAISEGVIEYLSPLECLGALIAPVASEAASSRYTHCEIHPCLVYSPMTLTIPFPDHNQGPRNCLPAADHEILTEYGFLNLQAILRFTENGKQLGIACYESGRLTLHKIGRESVVVGEATEFVGFSEWKPSEYPDNYDFIATPAHRMYGRFAGGEFATHFAGDVLKAGLPFEVLTGNNATRVFESAILIQRASEQVFCVTVPTKDHLIIARREGRPAYVVGNSYQTNMGKQGASVYAENPHERWDKNVHWLQYPQRALADTRASVALGGLNQPTGQNVLIALMCYTGFNIEDAIVVNGGAIQRGMFASLFHNIWKDDEHPNIRTGCDELFTLPDPKTIGYRKDISYAALNDKGMPRIGACIKPGDAIIGKIVTSKDPSVPRKDVSTFYRGTERAWISNVIRHRGSDGSHFIKVRTTAFRKPEIGDKLSSRSAQKGTIGAILPEECMPYLADGSRPDLVINPHALPSRMTIAKVLEMLIGEAGTAWGWVGDATAFEHLSLQEIQASLAGKQGVQHDLERRIYSGFSGEYMGKAFVGPCYYQRLKHMVVDKMHSRAGGKVMMMTRQPVEGRSRDGGLRVGEMERDCLLAHGSGAFVKERLMDVSDPYDTWVCDKCGLTPIYSTKTQSAYCRVCDSHSGFSSIRMPYAFKLLMQELQSMHITTRAL